MGEVAFFQMTGSVLALYGHEPLARDAGFSANTPHGFRGVACAINLASESEVDDVLRQVEAAGGQITKRAVHADWGGYSAYFSDPDGNAWEVAHNPGFAFDANGAVILPE